ncbi:Exocyst complex component [Wickerhamomyces ciferrii]|uniref:Exocyst complex component SEC15 n=1 Tax=Wickerhamomyces ciferrii (strain ATCC 14091 / BCRC 22168 / CBS 111 / JCM 3599 / NBRC 0793 / NRRL Y-1031 F-60-10) TaxID=1206466 RepID=K0KMH2_WICCF|nr:Exocyst complex component [Wickerhamomyces ciferrii]CCH42574.1 Exocyst complex component [Wickerhamomyces ciferrii]
MTRWWIQIRDHSTDLKEGGSNSAHLGVSLYYIRSTKMSKPNENGGGGGGSSFKQLSFLNESDPVTLLNSNNYLDQLVPIIKSNIKSNTIPELLETLNNEGLKKDDELTNNINSNEVNIRTTTTEIASISKNASTINEQVLDINDHLSKTSSLTIQKKFQMLALKKNINKINESIILINKILQILELTDRTHELIKNDKFFNALKNLNDLDALNKDFDKDFQFLQNINDSIPIMKNLVRDESISLVKRNLNTLDTKYDKISLAYYDKFTQILLKWDQFRQKNRDFDKYKLNSSVEISLRDDYLNKDDHLPQVYKFIDFGFIYDSFLIFKSLDQLPFLKNEFNKELNLRRDKILHPFLTNDLHNEQFKKYIISNDNLKNFLSKLIGFLIFHDLMSTKLPNIINQKTTDIWENLSAKIYPFLKELVANGLIETQKILDFKSIIGNFYLILEHFNLSGDHFYNLLIMTFKKFSQISTHNFKIDFQKLTEEDDSMPMAIYDIGLYRKISNISWYEDSRSENEIKFPQVLPFSTIYPMTCAQVRAYITHQTGFLKDYYKYDVESLNKLVIENVDNLLISVINSYFKEKLKLITREELSQNLINLEYFLIMSKEVNKLLSRTFHTDVNLKAINAISDTRKITERELFVMVDGKVEDLMDFIDWDWQTTELNKEPNYFMKDVGDFLKNMFTSTFSNLPLSVKTLLLYRVFDLLAIRFLENLNDQSKISKQSVQNFDIDIEYIETVSRELNPSRDAAINGTSRESLQSMFLQLRQCINLLKVGHLEEYKDQTTRMRKYDQIKPDDAVQLIKKVSNELSTPNTPIDSPDPSGGSKYAKFYKFRSNA